MSGVGAIISGTGAHAAVRQGTPALQVAQARAAAEELVSIALVQPILKELRDTNNAAGPFAPGTGEKAFGPLLDAAMSKQIVQGQGLDVVDAVAKEIGNPGSDAIAWSRARVGIETRHLPRSGQ